MVKQTIIELLRSTNRVGMDDLIKRMESDGFFEAPCSGKYHLAKRGGLAQHSLNVYRYAMALNEGMNAGINESALIICSLLHDLGKMGDYGKPNYISDGNHFKTNPELTCEEHEIRSLTIAAKYIELSEKEYTAILHHNGLYGNLDDMRNANYVSSPLAFIIHTADMYVSRFIEE